MSDINNLLNLMILVTGFYLVFMAINMKKKRELPKSIMGQNFKESDCRDADGFINYIWLKITILGVVVFCVGGFGLIDYNYLGFDPIVSLVGTVILAVALIIFVWVFLRGRKLYVD